MGLSRSRAKRGSAAASRQTLRAVVGLNGLRHLCLDRLEVEARGRLKRRTLDEARRELRHDLLHEDEPPELVGEPAVLVDRLTHARALERIEADVREDGPIHLDRPAEPALGL